MLFKKLTFDNYKAYYGHQEIKLYIPEDLRKEKKKNIILIGGLNGAGKTTVIKAILYVLFGKRGIKEEEHKKLFSNVINNKFFEEGGRDSSITLIIESDKGEDWELKVKWSFDNYKRVISESREIDVRKPGMKHGRHIKIDQLEVFNRFIDKIIPYHAAPFFIFDGEEINDIILRQNSKEMKDAIHKITGIETYRLLLEDLKSIQVNLQQTLLKANDSKKTINIKNELTSIEEEITKAKERLEKEKVEKGSNEKLIYEIKEQRNQKIIQNSKSRETIVKNLTKVTTDFENNKMQFDQFFKENIVSILLNKKIQLLKERLKVENTNRNKKIIYETSLAPYKTFMEELLKKEISPPLTNEQLEQIKILGEDIWVKENDMKAEDFKDYIEYHDVSNKDYQYLININVKSKENIIRLLNKIEKEKLEKSLLEEKISDAPESVDITEENTKIDNLSRKIGEIELRMKVTIKKFKQAKEQKANLLNQLTRLSGQVADFNKVKKQLDYINNIVRVVEQFVEKSTIMKANYIKEEFSYMLKKLFRKQDEFADIVFDIETYTIKLFNDRGMETSIDDRSAGEMQIISSALIWALTKASDLCLPVVIDTPLSRLDSFHRNHLIKYFYKELSDQVIILSTDTEVTKEYVEMMKENSYQQYLLDYDKQKKYTIIRDGYFNLAKV